MPNGDHIADTLVARAHTAIAAGEASETQMLIAVSHAESLLTRNVLCAAIHNEGKETREVLHRDIELAESEGITLFGRKFNRSSILLAFGISLGLHGVELVIILANRLAGSG